MENCKLYIFNRMYGSYRMNLLQKDIDILLSVMIQWVFFLVRRLLFLSRDFQNCCLINHWMIDSAVELVKKNLWCFWNSNFLNGLSAWMSKGINIVSGEVGFVLENLKLSWGGFFQRAFQYELCCFQRRTRCFQSLQLFEK